MLKVAQKLQQFHKSRENAPFFRLAVPFFFPMAYRTEEKIIYPFIVLPNNIISRKRNSYNNYAMILYYNCSAQFFLNVDQNVEKITEHVTLLKVDITIQLHC